MLNVAVVMNSQMNRQIRDETLRGVLQLGREYYGVVQVRFN